jgi:hypothetical protein
MWFLSFQRANACRAEADIYVAKITVKFLCKKSPLLRHSCQQAM